MHFSLMQWLLAGSATASVVLAGAILVVLLRDKRRSAFPIFLTYCGAYILIQLLAWSVYVFGVCGQYARISCGQYARIYWTVSVVHMALEFGVMYEIFRNALKHYSALVDLGKMIFTWAAVFLLATATITAFATSGPSATKLGAAFALVERSMRLMECGLLLLFFFFEKRLGLSWRNPNVSIALGLGTTASVDLIVSYLSARFPNMVASLSIIDGAAFVGVLGCWCYCLAARQSEPLVATAPSRLVLQRWNESLVGDGYANAAVASASSESFLPGIEKTVDKVLARKFAN
jgi:hypothetical protein